MKTILLVVLGLMTQMLVLFNPRSKVEKELIDVLQAGMALGKGVLRGQATRGTALRVKREFNEVLDLLIAELPENV